MFHSKGQNIKGIDDRELTENHVLLPADSDWFTAQTFERRKKYIFLSLGTTRKYQKAY